MPLDPSLRWQLALLRLFEGARAAQGATLLELAPASSGFVQAARLAGFASAPASESSDFSDSADIVLHWSFTLAAREKLRLALHEGSSFLFATASAQTQGENELRKALSLTFGKDVALVSLDTSERRFGLARLGGLLPRDRRVLELLTGRSRPDAGEVATLGPELGWFYAGWGRLAELERLLAAGGLRKQDATALGGVLCFEKGQLAQALPLLEEAVADEPLLGPWPWLLACNQRQLRVAELARSLHAEREATLKSELTQAREELGQQRRRVSELERSAAGRLSRGLTQALAMVPLGRATVAGIGMLRTHGPLATLGAVRAHLRYRLQARSDAAQRELNRMRRLARARRIASAITGRSGRSAQNPKSSPAPTQPAPPPASPTSEGALGRYRCLPLLSVLVRAQSAETVADCVRKVLAQSYPNLEVLVPSGAPESELVSTLGELADLPAVRIVQAPFARAFAQARGELVTWLEAGSALPAHEFSQRIDALLARPGSAPALPSEPPEPLRVHRRNVAVPSPHTLGSMLGNRDSSVRKVRTMQPARHLLPPSASTLPSFGCHLAIDANGALELLKLRRLIADNRWAFFMLLHAGPGDAATAAAQLLDGLENAAFFGTHPIGEPLALYSCFDWLLLPATENPAEAAPEALALAYGIGRPLVLAEPAHALLAPYQLAPRGAGAGSLEFCRYFGRDQLDAAVLDAYLDAAPPVGTQTLAAQVSAPLRPLRATLLIDTLDVGGLEEVVAFLTNNLGSVAIAPSVICFQSGGQVAERLRSQGHEVLVAEGDAQRLAAQLRTQKPDVINTHFANLEAVKIAHASGRPIVETIHNTYVWLDAARWQEERLRSQYFSAALAVSGLVSRYYQVHNPGFPAQRITVAENAIDPARLAPIPMAAARQILDLPEHATLLVSLGRYCYQKNQLGLLRAFAQVAAREPSVHLLLVGNLAQDALPYYELLRQVRDALPCAERIRFEPYRTDVSTVLSAADAVVLDSYFEGWSLAATEALLVGAPLIHSLCGSAEELCALGEGAGLIVPNPGGDLMRLDLQRIRDTAVLAEQPNHAALVAALTRIAAERTVWRERRDTIAACAARRFHPTAILHRYARAFRAVAQSPDPPNPS